MKLRNLKRFGLTYWAAERSMVFGCVLRLRYTQAWDLLLGHSLLLLQVFLLTAISTFLCGRLPRLWSLYHGLGNVLMSTLLDNLTMLQTTSSPCWRTLASLRLIFVHYRRNSAGNFVTRPFLINRRSLGHVTSLSREYLRCTCWYLLANTATCTSEKPWI